MKNIGDILKECISINNIFNKNDVFLYCPLAVIPSRIEVGDYFNYC